MYLTKNFVIFISEKRHLFNLIDRKLKYWNIIFCVPVLKFHKLSFDRDCKCCYFLPTLTAGTYILKHLNLLQPKLQITIGIRNSNPAFLAPDVTRWDFWLWGVALPTRMSLVERCKTFRSKWINRFDFFCFKSNTECSWGRWRNWILFKLVILITVFALWFFLVV